MTSAAGVERVEIRNFRCFSSAVFSPHAETNVLLGPNGSGKTSILEALHVLGVGRSFRVRELGPLVRHGESRFELRALLDQPRQCIEVRGGTGGLDTRLNDQNLRGSAELAGILPVQALHPEMHALIDGPPEGRRRFLDFGVFHVKPTYLEAWRRYYRALRQRNAALKRAAYGRDLEVWDAEMIRSGEEIDEQRRRYVDLLGQTFGEVATRILDAPAELRYRRGWQEGMPLESALAESGERDQLHKSTQVGPHRADLGIRFDSVGARHLASRGQQKLLVVSLGLAQARMIASTTPRRLVLLLDDPLAEIDSERAQRLVGVVQALPAQRFITGLMTQRYPGMADRVFHVKQGEGIRVI